MREDICTIPINEVFEKGDGCPVCRMRSMLKDRIVDYVLGPAMMEPDTREITNKKGFCRRHLPMLFGKGNRLGLALVLETHVKELSGKMTAEKQTEKLIIKSTYETMGGKYRQDGDYSHPNLKYRRFQSRCLGG